MSSIKRVEVEKASPDATRNGGNAGAPLPKMGNAAGLASVSKNATEKAAIAHAKRNG